MSPTADGAVGTEIIFGMLRHAKRFGLLSHALMLRTDGVVIPRPRELNRPDLVLQLRHSLLVANPFTRTSRGRCVES